ncbi:MAG: hypothetical protein KJ621_03100 [Proteobacteria bacterium]|nr:hypothetical protein [Pseudomonadota bacterium]
MKRMIVIGLLLITAMVTLAMAGPAGSAPAGDRIVGPASIEAGDWTPVSRVTGFCRQRCQNVCYRYCHRRYNCQRGPQQCYKGTTCHRGVCRDGQTICQPGPVFCPGGGDCYGDCKQRCEWRCRRRHGR